MRHKHMLRSAVVVTAVMAVAACGTGGDGSGSTANDASNAAATSGKAISGDLTLQTWALTPKFTDYLNGVIKGFEAKYPGTHVKLEDQPGDGYSDKVLSQASTDTLPDVVNLPPDFALPLVKQNLLVDIAKSDPSITSTYVPGGLTAYQYSGYQGTYGFPWYLGDDVDYWNSDLFTKCGLDPKNPPKTTDELFAQAKIMHDKCGGKEYLMSRKPGLGDLTLAGVKILADDGKSFVFNTPTAEALLQKYADAYKAGYMPADVLKDTYLGNSQLFTQGKVAWTTGGATSIPDFEKNNPSLKGKVVPTPSLDIPPLYVQGLSVSAHSKHQAAAVALAEWVTNAQNQNAFAHLVNVFPSTTSSQSDPFFSQGDGTPAGDAKVIASKELSTAKNLVPYEVTGAMNDYVAQQFALAISGKATPKEALDSSVKKLDQLLTTSN